MAVCAVGRETASEAGGGAAGGAGSEGGVRARGRMAGRRVVRGVRRRTREAGYSRGTNECGRDALAAAAARAARPPAATPSAQGRGGRSGVHGGGRVRPRRKTVPQSPTGLTDHRSQSQSLPTSAPGLSTRNCRACHYTAAAGRWHYGNGHAGARPACALAQHGIGPAAVTLRCTYHYEAATAGVSCAHQVQPHQGGGRGADLPPIRRCGAVYIYVQLAGTHLAGTRGYNCCRHERVQGTYRRGCEGDTRDLTRAGLRAGRSRLDRTHLLLRRLHLAVAAGCLASSGTRCTAALAGGGGRGGRLVVARAGRCAVWAHGRCFSRGRVRLSGQEAGSVSRHAERATSSPICAGVCVCRRQDPW
jgi:hypothetical protein